ESLHARAAQAEIDWRRHLGLRQAAASAAAGPARGRVVFRLQVLARRGDADRVQAGLDREADLEWIDFGFFAASLNPGEADLEDVFGVDREVVRDGHAGARVERQVFAQLLVARRFVRIAFRVVDLLGRLQREIADGAAADPARRRQVAIEQRRRGREHRGDVVEAVAGIVDRQPLAGTHIDGQEIANGVAVLSAIQPVYRRAPRIRMRRGFA